MTTLFFNDSGLADAAELPTALTALPHDADGALTAVLNDSGSFYGSLTEDWDQSEWLLSWTDPQWVDGALTARSTARHWAGAGHTLTARLG